MDKNLRWVNEQKILRTIDALKRNNMNGYLVKNIEDLLAKIDELVEEGSVVACGGSMSLEETGVIEYLKSGRYKFLDRTGLSGDELKRIYRLAFSADAFFSSTNAVTENGELYNVDGNGNRVSPMLFGPDKVIIIAGVNKIVKNVQEAVNRNRYISAPTNVKRLNINTPCSKTGYCVECSSSERICKEYTLIKGQSDENRIHVIFLNEQLGY